MLVISAVSIFTFVYAESTDPPDQVSSNRFSDSFIYTTNSPITNPYVGNRALGYSIFVVEKENPQYQWECLLDLWTRESNWRNEAQNKTSSAFGVAQFLNSTWYGTGYEKSNDPEIQIRAGLVYIEKRYSTACTSLKHHDLKNWY